MALPTVISGLTADAMHMQAVPGAAGSPTSAQAHTLGTRGSVEDDSSPASAPAGTPAGHPVSPACATAAMPQSQSAGMLPVSAQRPHHTPTLWMSLSHGSAAHVSC